MRTLVILVVVGVCSAVPFIQDTPAVAAEKARFFQAYRAAQAAATPQHQTFVPHQTHNPVHHYQPATYQAKWTGPVAATVPAGVNGAVTPVGNTADVNAARQAFFNAYQAQVAATVGVAPARHHAPAPQWNAAPTHNLVHGGHYQAQPKWTGPLASSVPAGLPGSMSQVADTPEVQAAKAAFQQAYQRQAAAAAAPSHYYG